MNAMSAVEARHVLGTLALDHAKPTEFDLIELGFCVRFICFSAKDGPRTEL